MSEEFKITSDTTLRAFLAHLQANARQIAKLEFERRYRLDSVGETHPISETAAEIQQLWEGLRIDIQKVLGVEIKPWAAMASPGPPELRSLEPDELNIRFSALKKRCDKARRKDPSIQLLKSFEVIETGGRKRGGSAYDAEGVAD